VVALISGAEGDWTRPLRVKENAPGEGYKVEKMWLGKKRYGLSNIKTEWRESVSLENV
jgi:hypothetical protein